RAAQLLQTSTSRSLTNIRKKRDWVRDDNRKSHLLQFAQQFADLLGAGEDFAALGGIWLSGEARLEFRDFVLELALLERAETAFRFFPGALRSGFEKDFEEESAVVFGKRFGEGGGIGTRAGTHGFDERFKNLLGF